MTKHLDTALKKDLTLTQLRYFIAAATHRSMTVAAAELYIAQSAISTAIAQLERTLGVPVFIRQPSKGLALTASGEQLLRDARSLLAQLDELTENIRVQAQGVEGVLRLACFVTLAPFILPQLISEIGDRHPKLRIEVLEADFDEAVKMLVEGTVEGALMYDFGPAPGVTFERLYRSAPHVILPAEVSLAQSSTISLSDLEGWDMVLLNLPYSREYFRNMLKEAGVETVVRHSSRSYETVRSLVARGHGFSILTNIPKTTSTYDGGQLRAIPLVDTAPLLDVCFAHAAGIRPSVRARAVAALAAEVLQDKDPSR